ncbi:MAG: DNA/RNA non-specific endonuclease [Bacteroidota bacterium]|nr:DNA/RNA non-specific endonuclease [Bacteroidota bacterium]
MKKIRILVVCILAISLSLFAIKYQSQQEKETENLLKQESQQKPYQSIEIPAKLENTPEIILYRKAYTVSYNKENLIPNWVAWKLTAEHSEGEIARTNDFREDKDIPNPRATKEDYRKSGWSRGHMFPAGDAKWDKQAMSESFLFTNICPQDKRLNSGDWNEIEMACRLWAKKYGEIYIVCGPILYNKEHITIGENRVVVPEAFFKVVLRLTPEPEAIGFVCKNVSINKTKQQYVNSVDEIERITGMDFFPLLDDKIEKEVEAKADISKW